MVNSQKLNSLSEKILKLMAGLPEHESVDRTIFIFIHSINSFFSDLSFSFEEGNLNKGKYHFKISQGAMFFGYIYMDGNVGSILPEHLEQIHNSIKLLAIILANKKQANLINDEKKMMAYILNNHQPNIPDKFEIFNSISANSPDIIMAYDHHFSCIYANKNVINLMGEVNTKLPVSLNEIDKLDRFKQIEILRELKQTKTSKSLHTRIVHSEFNKKIYEFHFIPAIENDEVHTIFCLGRDVSEKVKIERQLLKAKEKAEESDKLKLAFLANISHEIRTPLNGIIGFARLLSKPEIADDKRKNYLRIIESSTESLLRTMSNILEIANMESGEFNICADKFGLLDLLKEAYDEYGRSLKRKFEKNVDFVLEDNAIENSILQTDYYRVKEVIFNLLDNAYKFTMEGSITLGCYIKNNSAVFYIQDTGIGIRKKNLAYIFNRFYQEDSSETKEFGGLGLGLTISRAIVEKLGGKMWIKSVYKKGTTIYFNLPFKSMDTGTLEQIVKEENGIVRIEK